MKKFFSFLAVALICVGAVTEVRAEPVQPVDRFDTPMNLGSMPRAQLAQVLAAGDVQVAAAPTNAGSTGLPPEIAHFAYGGCDRRKVATGAAGAAGGLAQSYLGVAGMGAYDGIVPAPYVGAVLGGVIMGIAMSEIFGDHCGPTSLAMRAFARASDACVYKRNNGDVVVTLGRVGSGGTPAYAGSDGRGCYDI